MPHATITPEVEAVLRASTITEDNVLILPTGQLEHKLYESVNAVLVNCGGKWNRSLKGHVFPSDPRAKLGLALETGVAEDKKKTLQAFYTPASLAARVVELAEVNGKEVLEPSCGDGALIAECIAQGASLVMAIDIDEEAVQRARDRFAAFRPRKVSIVQGDFLKDSLSGWPHYDRIVANYPFSKSQDIKHLAHSLNFLDPENGVLVAIMSPMAPTKPAFAKALADWSYTTEDVPEGTFKESGTGIRTVIVKVTPKRA